ncbi:MAG TPA: enoyl-CoA hydratase, partial [Rubellimicrobium sp.]|nr:enoyl-CoA hydratase [Rubellimicrobium sp.]
SMGLLARIVSLAELSAAVDEEVGQFLACAPGAIADAKRLIRALGAGVDPAAVEASIAALVARWDTEEAREGIASFLDKRDPPWAS